MITVQLTRTARLRVHADTAEEAQARVESGGNGVQSLDDLYSPDGWTEQVIRVEPVLT